MKSTIQLPVVKGVESEDPEQFWFLVTSVWNAHGIMNDNIRKDTLDNALQDWALTWHIKYSSNHPTVGTAEIQTKLKKESRWPNLETQSIIGFKEIVMMPGETPWDLDQRLKSTIHEANMTLMDAHDRGLFVASLKPYLKLALS